MNLRDVTGPQQGSRIAVHVSFFIQREIQFRFLHLVEYEHVAYTVQKVSYTIVYIYAYI